MTASQATRLWQYTTKLGYAAEVHYAERQEAPRYANAGIVLRCRRGKEPWSWVFHQKEWQPLMRRFRDLDRTEGKR